jgi:hypothetical protein
MEQNEVASDGSHVGATTATIVAHEIISHISIRLRVTPYTCYVPTLAKRQNALWQGAGRRQGCTCGEYRSSNGYEMIYFFCPWDESISGLRYED